MPSPCVPIAAFFKQKEQMHNYVRQIYLSMLTIFNWSNAQIIVLEFRAMQEAINRIIFKIIEVIFELVCIFEF
jgi:thymidylate kinase